MKNFDTDSLFLKLQQFILDQGISKSQWNLIPDDEKIAFILDLSKVVEDEVNSKSFSYTQKTCFNSQVKKEEFRIGFKQEVILKSALFVAKKKYGFHVVNKEGIPTDKISVTGLEIIRSECPAVFRDALKDMLGLILRNASDADIIAAYNKYKREAKSAFPEDISENKGISGMGKWLKDGVPEKGCPYHVRAAAAYHRLLKDLNIEDKYPRIEDSSKNKLILVSANRWGIEWIMYDRWPHEFTDAGVSPDYDAMTEKHFHNKVKMLLAPMKKENIINQNEGFNLFFG